MDKEIKEILDKIKKVAYRETASRNALMEMKDKDYQLLLDYITKLERYVDETFLYTYEELQDKVIVLQFKVIEKQEKINKAIEYIEKSMNNAQPFYEYIISDENGNVQNLDKLLNILRGKE